MEKSPVEKNQIIEMGIGDQLDMITTYPVTVKSESDGETFEMTINVSGDTAYVTTSSYTPGPTEVIEPLTFTFESYLDTNGYLVYNDTTKTYWIVPFDPDEIPTVAMVGDGFASGSGTGSGPKVRVFVCECGGVPASGIGEDTGCSRSGSSVSGYKCLVQTCGSGCDGCWKDENLNNLIAPVLTESIIRAEVLVLNGTIYTH